MRQNVLMVALIGAVVTLGCIAYINTATNTSARPKSYRAAVMRMLDTQRVDYRDVEVADGCAPSYQLLPGAQGRRLGAHFLNDVPCLYRSALIASAAGG